MKNMKKRIIAMVLVVATILSFGCIGVFASDDVPSDLPKGTVKIAEGIYKYEISKNAIEPYNHIDYTTIDSIPEYGTIVQPPVLNNVIVESGHKYLILRISRDLRINLVRGNESIFGSSIANWPSIGGNTNTKYYIEASYYGIKTGVPYQMQLTSNGPARKNVVIAYTSNVTKEDYMD